MKAISGVEEFSMLGWCIGAILATVYSALRADDGLRNLILLTAPLDFSNKQGITFAKWVDERFFDVDKVLAAVGNMLTEMIDYGARALKPVDNYVLNYLKLWDNLDNPHVVEGRKAMNTWVTDNVPLAGGVFRQLRVDLYRNDRLMRGEWMMRTSGPHPHPRKSTHGDRGRRPHNPSMPVRSDLMTGSGAHKITWPHLEHWLGPRSK
jgi:polyhydroxyalkanoate synthase subunit PhaC